jgi:hypothetical protein
VDGSTAEEDADHYRNRCGGREAPDRVYRYVLAEAAARLTFDASGEGTDYPVVLGVSRDCEETRALLACAGDFRQPDPVVTLENAEAGEYYVYVDGGGPERWVSTGQAVALPADPRNFAARNDLNQNCWSDGGGDAFDCYGRTTVTFGGQSAPLDVSPGPAREVNIGGYGLVYQSELLGNTWRLTLEPAIENDERQVTFTVTGNLGCDGGCQAVETPVEFQGRQVRFYHQTDGIPRDPPITQLLLPGDPEQLGAVEYSMNRDNPTVNGTIALPATFYVALSFAESAAVRQALLNDVEIRAGGGEPDAPRFGNFRLSVTQE